MSKPEHVDCDRYDVLVLNKETRAIEAYGGSRMFLDDGYYSARAWRNTLAIKPANSEKLVEIGAHKNREIGSVFPESERAE